jgi:ATP-dependent Clp protease ATP-binding subunit ClpB
VRATWAGVVQARRTAFCRVLASTAMAAEQTIHLERYAPDAKALVAGAQSLADERKHPQVEPIHLLARAIDRDRGVAEVFKKSGADPADVAVEAEAQLNRLAKATSGLAYLSNAMLSLLGRAEKESDGKTVGVDHLLNALAQEIRGPAAAVLQSFALGPGSFRPHMAALKSVPRDVPATSSNTTVDASKFTHDLVERAKRGEFDPVIGRDIEVRRVLQILERRQKNHPLLVGEPGVGKAAIVHALAMRIAAGDVPESLSRLSILELETGAIVAGAKLRGEIEERLKQVLGAVKTGNDAILFINSLDSLLGQGAAGSGVGDLMKPLLARGEVRLLASTTQEGMRKMQERDPGLVRRFTVLDINPPTPDQAIEILRGIATRYEEHHEVQIGDPAIVSAVRLAKRYLQDRALPDTAIDLLDEAAARKRVELDGVPEAVDSAIRRLASLKAQAASLAGDKDVMSTKSRQRIEAEIAALEPSVSEMRTKLDAKRGALAAHAALRQEVTRLEASLVEAREKQDFARLGELEHVTMPDAKRKLEAAEAALHEILGGDPRTDASNVVEEEDVARVLGDWTGIPVAKMLESDAEKLLKMEERLSARVVARPRRCAPCRVRCGAGAWGCAIRGSRSGRSSSSGRAASGRPSSPRRWRSSSSTTNSR